MSDWAVGPLLRVRRSRDVACRGGGPGLIAGGLGDAGWAAVSGTGVVEYVWTGR